MDPHPQHPACPFAHPGGARAWRIPDLELLSSRVAETQPSQAASALGLRDKGLPGVEKIGMEGCLYTWDSQIPQLTEEEDRRVFQMTIQHTLIVSELGAFQTSSVMKAPDIRQAEEAKQPQGMVTIDMALGEAVDDLLWLMHSIFISVVIYLCLSCSKMIFVQHSKRQWLKSINYNGAHITVKRKEDGRMEEK